MAKISQDPLSHSSVNPVEGGCHGCPLSPTPDRITLEILSSYRTANVVHTPAACLAIVSEACAGRTAREIYKARRSIARKIQRRLGLPIEWRLTIEEAILRINTCPYPRSVNHGGKDGSQFVTIHSGAVEAALRWPSLSTRECENKPWITTDRRIVVICEQGELLHDEVSFDQIFSEVITPILSPAGERHIWLWYASQAERLHAFGEYSYERGINWPINLVPVVSVMDNRTAEQRIPYLSKLNAPIKAVAAEPLRERPTFSLQGLDWLIVGGEMGLASHPFYLSWARELRDKCIEKGIPLFIKQLGSHVRAEAGRLKYADPNGRNWREFPVDLHLREYPQQLSILSNQNH